MSSLNHSDRPVAKLRSSSSRCALAIVCSVTLLGPVLFALLLFKHLSYPVLWNDEGETVMYGERVLEYGYPKVHGPRNTVYLTLLPESVAVDPETDAYLGTAWGHFYVAALGVALAAHYDDPDERTLRVRAPFAVAGALGLLALAVLVLRAGRAASGGWLVGLIFAGLFFWLASLDVSLILQLREARYPPLVVLLSSLLVIARVIRPVSRRARLGWDALACGSLIAVFLTFVPAFIALVVGTTAASLAGISRRGGSSMGWRRAVRELAPIGVALLAVAAATPYFHTFSVAAAQSRLAPGDLVTYATNPGRLIAFFTIHGHLALLAALRLVVIATARHAAHAQERAARGTARVLLFFAAGYALVMAAHPALFGRYVTPISAWICAAVALDALRLFERLRAATGTAPRLAAFGAACAAGAALLCAAWHVPALAQRWHEIWHRYRGPLDHAIAFVRSTYPETRDLVISTNYEDTVLMYYLGARVVRPETATPGEIPDVVIPRRAWPGARMLARWEPSQRVTALPVADLPYNNIPEVFAWKAMRVYGLPTHQYHSPLPGPGRPPLRIHSRATRRR